MAARDGGAMVVGFLLLVFLSVGSAHNSRRLFLETSEGTVAPSPAAMHVQPIDDPKYEALNLDWSDEKGKQDTEPWFATSLIKYDAPSSPTANRLELAAGFLRKGSTSIPKDGISGIEEYQRAPPRRVNAIQG